tara:strand:- start:498 stop:2003 length:1506 start_codon:yes stop_codon:yes gene_type:complete
MSKHIHLSEFFKKISIIINNLIIKNSKKLNLKEKKNLILQLISLKRVLLSSIILLTLFLSFLSLPAVYDKSKTQDIIKNQLYKRYNIKFIFSTDMKYNLFPWPNYKFENVKILNDDNEQLADLKNLKINLEISNFFSPNNFRIREVFLTKAKFNLYKKDLNFFFDLLDNDFSKSKIKILDSYVFLKNDLDEVLLINKIKQMNYFHNFKRTQNILSVKNEIFNIPYSLEIYNDRNEKKIFSKINIKILRLLLEGEYSYADDIKVGFMNIVNNQNKSEINYSLNGEKLSFEFNDKMNDVNFNYDGQIYLKPFYLDLSGKIKKINLKYIFETNSLLQQLLKTNVFNNKNLNIVSKINAEKIIPYHKLINFLLNFRIKEGLIDIDDSKFSWYDYADFEISDSLIYVNKNNLMLDGRMKIKIKDYNEIYKFFQTPRNFRKKIKNLEFVFNYNFDQTMINITDMKIDNQHNQKVGEILNKLVSQENILQNRIYLKNLINRAIKAYAG